MKGVHDSVLELIGRTPLVRIGRLNPKAGVTVCVKLEYMNPGGSVKDRPAYNMILRAEEQGLLTPDKTIIEATSGNTGIGIAMVAAVKGYKVVLTMPETASIERRKILKALGAEIILTPGDLGTDGAIEEAYDLARRYPDRYYLIDQFNNPANPEAHVLTTGREILEATEGGVDVVVATLGTTGTAMGLKRYFMEHKPEVKVVAVEPYVGHRIQGLKNMKESFRPGLYRREELDRVLNVYDEDAYEMARRLAREEGIFVGMSSGAAMCAALKVAQEMEEGLVVAVLPDGGERYLSTTLFAVELTPDFSFYNLRTRSVDEFMPLEEGRVTVYSVGPSLYSPAHLGILRRLVFADVLGRFLAHKGYQVLNLVGVTDWDEMVSEEALAQKPGEPSFARRMEEIFLKDSEDLLNSRDIHFSKLSDYLDEASSLTDSLMTKGFAYEKLRSVYFDISKAKTYGSLSGVDLEKIRLGARVDPESYEKLNPRDFTLLRRASLAEMKAGAYLKSRWGNVVPTWHLAAVAMTRKHLGEEADIIIGSQDLVFPHLENIDAVGEALAGKSLAPLWLNTNVVDADGKKMSRAAGNAVTLADTIARGYSGREVRFWMLSTHYRKPLSFSTERLKNARAGLLRIDDFQERLRHIEPAKAGTEEAGQLIHAFERRFREALNQDLNAASGLTALFGLIRGLNPILDKGLLREDQKEKALFALEDADLVLGVLSKEEEEIPPDAKELAAERELARQSKDFAKADALRESLKSMGYQVEDSPSGTRLKKLKH